jgi:hypothetical protein
VHTNPLTGARYPDNTDATNLAQYYQNVVDDLSPQSIPSFSSATARDTAYSSWVAAGNTMRTGLFCVVAGQLMEYRGSWQLVTETKLRQLSTTATGTLASGSSVNLVAAQTIPASLFGTSVSYMIDVDVQVQLSLPSGGGCTLAILFDGTGFYSDVYTNPSTTMTYTAKCHGPLTIADNLTHTVTAQLTSNGGTLTVTTNGHLALLARPYVIF